MKIKERFKNINNPDTFQRIDDNHILDLYIGKDGKYRSALYLVSEQEPLSISSAKIISINIWKREDGKWGTVFSLDDVGFEDLFSHFCEDIIESSRHIRDKNKGAVFISDRYKKWQSMLAKFKGDLFTESQIKGLIGEICFMKEYLIPNYGEQKTINAWIGPEKTNQDFIFENTWYEVKSVNSGAESVKISSIEQLDNIIQGTLAIVYLDKTSHADIWRMTLNSIIKELSDSFSDQYLKDRFRDILLDMGYYYRIEYDKYGFKFSGISRYIVNSNFPCIRRIILPSSVINCNYNLSLSSINNFLER